MGPRCQDCAAPISKYSRGRCKPCGYEFLRRPVPSDFVQVLGLLGSIGAASHYGASATTITRWRNQIGLGDHLFMRPIWQEARM